MRGSERVLIIPDTHLPFHHQDSFAFLGAVKGWFQPTVVVHLGDEIDCHTLSKWAANPDGLSSGKELDLAIDALHDGLYKLFPKVFVCTSNHTIRPYKRATEAGIPKRVLKPYSELLEAPPGWVWQDRWIVDDVIFEHGEHLSGQYAGATAARHNMRSTVIGHIHSFAGIHYLSCTDKIIFGFNAGCLIDVNSYAMEYGKKLRNKPVLGLGLLANGVPSFVPMVLDEWGRWTGGF